MIDTQTGNYNIIVEAEKDEDNGFAADVALLLMQKYPGHPWHINVMGGVLIIKHMRMSNKWGMVRKLPLIRQDWSFVKKEVTRAAGEMLERANLKRDAWEDTKIALVEGIPEKDRIFQ